ncbi:hypothetical protein SL053_002600 [Flavobacterium psychrophilum]|nr:hypothetical protein [Flavobacterium psychrophilum]
MVTESQFVKYALKENDTLESVAKELHISIEYLMLMHNDQAIMFDKIKSRYEGFPVHLTEIFVTKETIIQVEEKKQKKTGYAIFPNKFYEKRTYGFSLENYENELLKTKIHYELEMVYVKKDSSSNILEINRKQVYINNKEPEFIIEQLADKISQTIFPIQVKLSGQGEIEAIENHEEIKKRWASNQESLKDYYEEDITEKIIAKSNSYFNNKHLITESLSKNWFFNLYFKPIYGSYGPSKEIIYNSTAPIFANNEIEYSIKQNIEEVYTTSQKLVINAIAETKNTTTANEVLNNTIPTQSATNIQNIESQGKIQYKLTGSDNTIFTIFGTFLTKINEQKTNTIQIEIFQL